MSADYSGYLDQLFTPRKAAALWVACLAIIGADRYFDLLAHAGDYRPLATVVVWGGLFFGLAAWFIELDHERRRRKAALAHLTSLTHGEAELLLGSIDEKTRTVGFRRDVQPEGHQLLHKGLIEKVSADGFKFHDTCCIPAFVWTELQKPGVVEMLRQTKINAEQRDNDRRAAEKKARLENEKPRST